MLMIITGKIDSGKTSKLLSIYNDSGSGDGFILRKVYMQGVQAGQEAVWLSTGACKPFSFRKGFLPQGWDEAYDYGPFSFSGQGLAFAENILKSAVQMQCEPLYIDEIGPLELQGKGFAPILTLALESRKNVYITVRDSCLDAVLMRFNIGQFKVVTI